MNADKKKVAIVVAHPDDELLWVGGLLIDHPDWDVFVACLCRRSDTDRSRRFNRAMELLGTEWNMGDLDDGIEQKPLPIKLVQQAILRLLPKRQFDLVVSHNPNGEYTRHRRHEEVGMAVIRLWHLEKIKAKALWTFAYEDGNRMYLPRAITKGTYTYDLSPHTWQKKYRIITEIYGFDKDSWEALTTPRHEAFLQLKKTEAASAVFMGRRGS